MALNLFALFMVRKENTYFSVIILRKIGKILNKKYQVFHTFVAMVLILDGNSRYARQEQSLLFDLFKACDKIEIILQIGCFLTEKIFMIEHACAIFSELLSDIGIMFIEFTEDVVHFQSVHGV